MHLALLFLMKTKLHSPFIGLVLPAVLAQIQTMWATVTFSATPYAVRNTFIGPIPCNCRVDERGDRDRPEIHELKFPNYDPDP